MSDRVEHVMKSRVSWLVTFRGRRMFDLGLQLFVGGAVFGDFGS